MTTYYKAVRPDGGSFKNRNFKWNTEPGGVTTHPNFRTDHRGDASFYLSVATVPTDCTGSSWPLRLLEVEAVGEAFAPHIRDLPNKRAAEAFRTIRELPAHLALGPQGEQIVALIERAEILTRDEGDRLDVARNAVRNAVRYAARNAARDAARNAARNAARDAARNAAWDAAGSAAWDAAGSAAWDAAGSAAWDAAGALVVRDLIGADFTQGHYDVLTRPWRTVVGPIHPDDPAL